MITNSIFTGNTSEEYGGAIFISELKRGVIGGDPSCGNCFAGNSAQLGDDICYGSMDDLVIDARYNTFDRIPTEERVISRRSFNLAGCQFPGEPLTTDLFLSPEGSNENDGLTPETPLKTLSYALSRLVLSGETGITIQLAEGVYSPSLTGEEFPVLLPDNTILRGYDRQTTILDAEESEGILDNALSIRNVIENITFTGTDNGSCGALFCTEYASPVIRNCHFTVNKAMYGGGISAWYDASPRVINCLFTANTAERGGGAFNYGAGATYMDCIFQGNVSSAGGGVYNGYSDSLFMNCRFIENTAYSAGGGVYCWQDNGDSFKHDQFHNCLISGNVSNRGGGIRFAYVRRAALVNCVISNNRVTENGAGVAILESRPVFENVLIHSNSSEYMGGGIYSSQYRPVVSNCTVAGNSALSGGGIYVDEMDGFTISNSIVFFNYPDSVIGENPSMNVSCSDVQGGFPGRGNIDSDPFFVDAAGADFHLIQGETGAGKFSPCVDAGGRDAVDIQFRIFGNIVNLSQFSTMTEGGGDTSTVDMGYHYLHNNLQLNPAVHIRMDKFVEPGDTFEINADLYSPWCIQVQQPLAFAVYFHGEYYFWPDWTTVFDSRQFG
ncbi:MAG TPA: DUF1565 domain-containing protein, partial [bacterium]|nr:DUF1565 domain-containing protein [bacterium]